MLQKFITNVTLIVFTGLLPSCGYSETTSYKEGGSYNKEDIASCEEEAEYEGMKGGDLTDYVQTCLEDFESISGYENMTEGSPKKSAQ